MRDWRRNHLLWWLSRPLARLVWWFAVKRARVLFLLNGGQRPTDDGVSELAMRLKYKDFY